MTKEQFLNEWNGSADRILVHTSGSTGLPKQMWVEKRRMEASARRTCHFLGLKEGDTALLCLSPDFIAGKMMIVRSEVCALRLTTVEPSSHPLATTPDSTFNALANKGFDFVAMVPMQVFNSLQVPAECERLKRIRHLIIGGGAIDDALEAELRSLPNAIWSTYGMTETLSHIALRRINPKNTELSSAHGSLHPHAVACFPHEESSWYTPFDNVSVSLNEENCLVIDAPEVCNKPLVTNDIAELHPDGRRFRILGRKDNVICSGGLKIQIEEIERQLRPHLPFPFLVTKRPDAKFGEAMVLLMQGGTEAAARPICAAVLPRHYQPRHYLPVDSLPTTPTGKPARAEAERLAKEISSPVADGAL